MKFDGSSEILFFTKREYNPAHVGGFSRQSSGRTSFPIKKRQFVIIVRVTLFEYSTVNGIFEKEITPRVLSNLPLLHATR